MPEHLHKFMKQQSSRIEVKDLGPFVGSWHTVLRYRKYLDLVLERYEVLTGRDSSSQAGNAKKGRKEDWFDLLQLELETFYLFSKILLDRAARAVESYFGPARKLSLDSHDQAVKHLEKYAKVKGLSGPSSDVISSLKSLKVTISDYRDYQIAHQKNPRLMKALMINPQGQAKLSDSVLLPEGNERLSDGEYPEEMLEQIDKYILGLVAFIAANEAKTVLTLKGDA